MSGVAKKKLPIECLPAEPPRAQLIVSRVLGWSDSLAECFHDLSGGPQGLAANMWREATSEENPARVRFQYYELICRIMGKSAERAEAKQDVELMRTEEIEEQVKLLLYDEKQLEKLPAAG